MCLLVKALVVGRALKIEWSAFIVQFLQIDVVNLRVEWEFKGLRGCGARFPHRLRILGEVK